MKFSVGLEVLKAEKKKSSLLNRPTLVQTQAYIRQRSRIGFIAEHPTMPINFIRAVGRMRHRALTLSLIYAITLQGVLHR